MYLCPGLPSVWVWSKVYWQMWVWKSVSPTFIFLPPGITGTVSIDANGDRNADYSLLDLDPVQNKFQVSAVIWERRKQQLIFFLFVCEYFNGNQMLLFEPFFLLMLSSCCHLLSVEICHHYITTAKRCKHVRDGQGVGHYQPMHHQQPVVHWQPICHSHRSGSHKLRSDTSPDLLPNKLLRPGRTREGDCGGEGVIDCKLRRPETELDFSIFQRRA